MTISKIRRHARTNVPAKRSPEQPISGTPSNSSGQAVNTNASRAGDYAKNIVASNTSPSTIALSVLLAIAVLALIGGCVFWKVKKRRSQKTGGPQPYYPSSPNSTLFGIESRVYSRTHTVSSSFGGNSTIEKPDKAFIIHPFPHEESGWVPQIKNYHGVPLVNGQLPRHVQAAKEGKRWLRALSGKTLNENASGTLPPSYAIANVDSNRSSDATLVRMGPPGIPLPTTPADSTITVQSPTPTNQHSKEKSKPSPLSSSETSTAPSSRFSLTPLPQTPATTASDPLPSPARNSSFSYQQGNPASPLRKSFSPKQLSTVFKSGTGSDGLPLPRLMAVINTFTPSLEDEMSIRIGDTVRMIEEYNDGWCLVQRVGKSDSPKGVVPRFCLTERQSAVLTSSARKNLIKSIQASAKLR